MITHLRAQNFKSWKDTGDLRLGRLTGLFGTNSSGKTSILQILPLLKQTAEFPDRNRVLYTGTDESPVTLGTLLDIIHGHHAEAAVKLCLTWTDEHSLANHRRPLFDPLYSPTGISFSTSIFSGKEGPTVDSFEYGIGEIGQERVGMRRILGAEEKYQVTQQLGQEESVSFQVGAPIKCYGFPPDALREFGHVAYLPDLQLAFENLFRKVHYLGPLRSYPWRVYEWGGEKPLDAGWNGEQAIPALLASETVTQVADWLKQMGLIHSFRLQPVGESRTIYQCHVKITPTATEVLLPEVGFGVSQILPVLANCATLPDDSTLLLEQPEIHLHPFAQAALADVLIDAIKNRNIQIIVESHSEHLLRRIQRRIAREVLRPDDTALYFCHLENGTSAIEKLDVDSYGNIRNWPKDFFGDEMGELADMTVAAMERQKAGRK
jgi:predicted ATPase